MVLIRDSGARTTAPTTTPTTTTTPKPTTTTKPTTTPVSYGAYTSAQGALGVRISTNAGTVVDLYADASTGLVYANIPYMDPYTGRAATVRGFLSEDGKYITYSDPMTGLTGRETIVSAEESKDTSTNRGSRSGGGGSTAVVPRAYLEARARAIWMEMGCIGPIPLDFMNTAIDAGYLNSDDGILVFRELIRTRDEWWIGADAGTERLLWEDDWETRIGQPLTEAARARLDEMFRLNYSRTQWNDWLEDTAEYAAGIEMMALRENYLQVLYDSWGIGQVDDIVARYALDNPGKDYITDFLMARLGRGASSAVIGDWARQQPEWLNGPNAASTRENLTAVYTSIMREAPDADWLTERVLDGWTADQMVQYLRTTADYQKLYAAKPVWMSEAEFNSMRDSFNAVGRWYYRQAGTLQTLTEAEVQALRDQAGITDDSLPPGVHTDTDGNYVTWEGAWEISDAQLGAMLDQGWTPAEWEQHLRYTEQALGEIDTMNHLGEAIGKVYTDADAFAVVSGGQGAGRIKAELTKAEHRRSFDTVFAIINGRMPTLADYEMLENDYVSAEHYYQTMTARQNAEAQFPEVDEMFRRVYGYGADLEKLVAVNLNQIGSGAYEALIQAAEELDRYTLAYREWARRDPSPEDYARFAQMAGPDELIKEIEVLENMRSKGPKIRQIYDAYWGEQGLAPLSDDELQTLLGQYEGWGALQARLDMATERRKLREQSVEMSLRWGAAIAPIAYTEFGGPKLPGLKRIGG